MSTDTITLELEARTVTGKAVKQLRADGKVPAIIHNHGKPSIQVMSDFTTLHKVYVQAGKHHPVQLEVGGVQHLAMIKDVDIDPVKHVMRHVVFQAIKQNEEVEAEVPVVFAEGVEIPAEKLSLLVLKQLDHVEIKALPKDLPDSLVVDPSGLSEEGDHLTVADLIVPAGVTVLTLPETQIAIVETPRDQLAEAEKAAAEQAEADGKLAETTEATEGAEPATEGTTEPADKKPEGEAAKE